jgi:hypothetical protein
MNKVQKKFIEEGLVRMQTGGLWFTMSKENAIKFVEECKKESIIILGIDGFYIRGKQIQPTMEFSIDFSSYTYKSLKDCYEDSIDFLNKINEDLFFEIVCAK